MSIPIIAVTGAGGFVGTKLVQYLRELGHSVVALRRGREPRCYDSEAEADLTNAAHIAALVQQGLKADVIVHLAGSVQVELRPDPADPEHNCVPGQVRLESLYAANVLGTANAVDLARACGARKLVFASSQTVYGYGEDGVADETTPLRPLEHYATSKVCSEQLLKMASHQGLQVVVLRFPGIFSPQRADGAVYAMCRSALKQHIVVRSECAVPFDVLALDDLLPAIERAIAFDGAGFEVFNLSTGEPCSLELLASHIARLVPGTRVEKLGVSQPSFRMHADRALRLLQWRAAPIDQRLAEVLSALAP
jgi:nucleoside-diphosphate-sugar epimerase